MNEPERLKQPIQTPRLHVAGMAGTLGFFPVGTALGGVGLAVSVALAVVFLVMAIRWIPKLNSPASVIEYRSGDFPTLAYIAPLVAVAGSFPVSTALVDSSAIPPTLAVAGGWAFNATAFAWWIIRSETQGERIGRRRLSALLADPGEHELSDEHLSAADRGHELLRALLVAGAIDGVTLKETSAAAMLRLDMAQLSDTITDLKRARVIADGGPGARDCLTITPAGVLAMKKVEKMRFDDRMHRSRLLEHGLRDSPVKSEHD